MKIYAYKNISSILKESSSGGAYTRIVTTIINNLQCEYAIYGAAWTNELYVKHIRVNSIEDIVAFNGSKYLRSDIQGVYQLIEKDIRENRFIIFSGTPCQISGLKKYLENKRIFYEKIITIDIICHGVPKPIVWQDCKKWLEKKYKHRIVDVTFRDKTIGWKRYPTTVIFDNGKHVKWTYWTQTYMRMYLSSVITEQSCFFCQFSNMNRISDITIGDFWGIQEAIPLFDKKGGVSLILANTQMGEEICEYITRIANKEESIEEFKGDYSILKKYQSNLNRATKMPDYYKEFWQDYYMMDFADIIKKYNFVSIKGRLIFYLKSICVKIKYFDERLS